MLVVAVVVLERRRQAETISLFSVCFLLLGDGDGMTEGHPLIISTVSTAFLRDHRYLLCPRSLGRAQLIGGCQGRRSHKRAANDCHINIVLG